MKTLNANLNLSRLITPAICCALALSCGAASIAADHSDDVPQAAAPHALVKFGDLDLSTPQGAATLYGRIVVAANEVCESFDIDSRALADPLRRHECVRKTIAEAVAKVGRPELLAIYGAKMHQPVPIRVAGEYRSAQ